MQNILNILTTRFGGPWSVTKTDRTHFSNIYYCRNGTKSVVAKALVPEMFGDDNPAREQLAERLNRNTEYFRSVLASYGVPVPKLFIAERLPQNHQAIQIASDEGLNCHQLLAEKPTAENARLIIRGILEAVVGVLHQPEPPQVGLDLQLSNFTSNSHFCYVDIFPPLVLDPSTGVYMVHEPQPLQADEIEAHVWRKFTAYGTLKRFRFFLMSISKSYEQIFFDELERVLEPGLWQSVKSYFMGLPDQQFKGVVTRAQLERFIDSVSEYDNELRDVAVRIIPDVPNRQYYTREVFRLIRNPSPGEPRPANPKQTLKELLMQFVT